MRNSIPPYFFWSVWRNFSTWERLFLAGLCVVSVYAFYSVIITVFRVRCNSADTKSTFLALHRRSMRLQRLIGAAFYLFGTVLFLSLQWAYVTIDDNRTPGGWVVLENFAICFAFAFNAFIAFLILHAFGWFVANQVDNLGSQLEPRELPSPQVRT